HYVRRNPMLPALEHFNQCIDEASGTHFCLFHDDDLMSPDFVQQARAAMVAFPDAVAIGCNAHVESDGALQARPSFLSPHQYDFIASPSNLGMRYFGRLQSGIAPFPGYVYHRALVGDQRFHADEGKYSDVTWLLRLAKRGSIVWINKPLMIYRMHGGNDGLIESRRDRLRFLAYLKRHRASLGEGLLQDYRCSFIFKPIAKQDIVSHPARRRLAQRFLQRYRWQRYARLDTYRAALRRALVKHSTRP
ncbi:MAG: glycosyltransferase family 2 protein, partial [Hylemonella sp.]|nr:glycosyltransferase family 2 protein [Hylemonella sp.]